MPRKKKRKVDVEEIIDDTDLQQLSYEIYEVAGRVHSRDYIERFNR